MSERIAPLAQWRAELARGACYDLATDTGPLWTLEELVCGLASERAFARTVIGEAPPAGDPALRDAIAGYAGVDPAWVVVTTGAPEAYGLLFGSLAPPGARILLPDPVPPAAQAIARACRLRVDSYPLRREGGFRQSKDHVLVSAPPELRLAVVATPHNPTGAVMPRSETAALGQALARRGALLVVDEVGHPLYFGRPEASAAGLENVVVIGDMGGALSLPGLRVGWIIDPDRTRRARLIAARASLALGNSPVTDWLAAEALRRPDAILNGLAAVARANLARLRTVLDARSDTLGWVAPAGGTTVFPWFRDGRSSRRFCEALAERGVLVAPGDVFGHPAHMRIGFGALAEGFSEALEIFDAGMASIPPAAPIIQ